MADLTSWMTAVLPNAAAALLLLIAGAWIASWAGRSVARFLEHHRVLDPTYRGVFTALVRYLILLLAAVAALQQVGIQTTSILATIGAVIVAVGLALQEPSPTLPPGSCCFGCGPSGSATSSDEQRRRHRIGGRIVRHRNPSRGWRLRLCSQFRSLEQAGIKPFRCQFG